MTTREKKTVPYQIIVGVDGSDSSRHALAWAIDQASLREGRVTAVLAWQLPLIGIPGAFDTDEIEQGAKDVLNGELAAMHCPDDVQLNTLVAQGDPSEALIHLCERFGADLLVLGSRGRGGFRGLRLGSVSGECAAHAPCPVTIVKYNQRDSDTHPRAVAEIASSV
jgi:nucleotide-binding universal stress UspA family protein